MPATSRCHVLLPSHDEPLAGLLAPVYCRPPRHAPVALAPGALPERPGHQGWCRDELDREPAVLTMSASSAVGALPSNAVDRQHDRHGRMPSGRQINC